MNATTMTREERLGEIAARMTIAVAKAELDYEAAERGLKPKKIKGKPEPFHAFTDRVQLIRDAHRTKIRILTKRRDSVRRFRVSLCPAFREAYGIKDPANA